MISGGLEEKTLIKIFKGIWLQQKEKNNLVIYDHTTIHYIYNSDGLIQYLYLVSPHKESEDLIVKPLFKILQRFKHYFCLRI